mmetsp:Transcript_10458/g.23747  ORF Transcript_10458/g.23747 Transcript_10458/m.23747 type:complete len:89 (+) Transcript_10458:248-514(+)
MLGVFPISSLDLGCFCRSVKVMVVLEDDLWCGFPAGEVALLPSRTCFESSSAPPLNAEAKLAMALFMVLECIIYGGPLKVTICYDMLR